MPISVSRMFEQFHIEITHAVQWGIKPNQSRPGIYIISTSSNPRLNLQTLARPSVDPRTVQTWLANSPRFTLDGLVPVATQIEEMFLRFWHPQENILYIGKASEQSVKARVGYFYCHQIGKDSPHGGGQWVKALTILNSLHVYVGQTDNSAEVEFLMLKYFASQTSGLDYDNIDAPATYLPFANREIKWNGYCRRKQHGCSRAFNR